MLTSSWQKCNSKKIPGYLEFKKKFVLLSIILRKNNKNINLRNFVLRLRNKERDDKNVIKKPRKVQNDGDYIRVTSQMRNQLCGRLSYTVAIVVSRYEIIAKLLLSLANLINGRTLSLIHVICTYPPERRERLSS